MMSLTNTRASSPIFAQKLISSKMQTVKGINNPGNIRAGAGKFLGEIKSPDNFRAFSDLFYGYRAILKIFDTYYKRGLTTLAQMLMTYAPPSDNNPTNAYIDYVSKGLSFPANTDIKPILYGPRAKDLMRLISRFEQGKAWKDDEIELDKAFRLFQGQPVNNSPTNLPIILLAIAGLLYLTRT
jgi:hypothetical protein